MVPKVYGLYTYTFDSRYGTETVTSSYMEKLSFDRKGRANKETIDQVVKLCSDSRSVERFVFIVLEAGLSSL